MKPEIKKLWIDALRSGKYRQGREALEVRLDSGESSYCCLGVLCQLWTQETGEDWRPLITEHSSETLPPKVQEWAGLLDDNPYLRSKQGSSIGHLNDHCDASFQELAGLIESDL